MHPTDRQILEEFAARVRQIEPRARIWAFGSRVRDQAGEGSDLDLCVALPEVTFDLRRAISRTAWEVGYDHERLVISVVFSDEEFEQGPMSASPLVKNILREGIAA
jgi:predicted nucleotidyltransferase